MVDARAKGRRAEGAFARMLEARGFDVIDTTCGKEGPDVVTVEESGVVTAWEVKNRNVWTWTAFRKQAKAQAGRKRWALACKVPGNGVWYVERQGQAPELWHEGAGNVSVRPSEAARAAKPRKQGDGCGCRG